ncbi:hypothetical protein D3C81_822700 [compost metagenome]
MNQQRQQCLQAHVAQRRHGIARVGYALDVQAVEAALLTLLGYHGNGAAPALFIKGDATVASTGQQLRQALRRRHPPHHHSRQRHAEDCCAHPSVQCFAAPDYPATDCGSDQSQHHQGTHQANAGNQHETGEHDANDAAHGVQGDYRADIPTNLRAVHA